MACRVIQTFIKKCADCPNCNYNSGGSYICTLTDQDISAKDKQERVASKCPLPYAGG